MIDLLLSQLLPTLRRLPRHLRRRPTEAPEFQPHQHCPLWLRQPSRRQQSSGQKKSRCRPFEMMRRMTPASRQNQTLNDRRYCQSYLLPLMPSYHFHQFHQDQSSPFQMIQR